MTQAEIFALLERFETANVWELKYRKADESITLRKAPPAPTAPLPAAQPLVQMQQTQGAAVQQPQSAPQAGRLITAPLVGTFYAAASPEAAPFVTVGQTVEQGQTLCIIEAMKMLNEVPSPCSGTVVEVLAQNEELVGFEAPLFRVQEK